METNSIREMHNKLFPQFNELVELVHKQTEIQNRYSYLLSRHGWYLSGRMTAGDVYDIFVLVKDGELLETENRLIRYYKSNLTVIKKGLCSLHTDRKSILTEAFLCHKKGLFFASTMLFLSQGDGICSGKVFTGQKKLKAYLESISDSDLLNSVLTQETAINVDTRSPNKLSYSSDLNRHAVMHGLDSTYGSEKNSLKALSLLCFISDFINLGK